MGIFSLRRKKRAQDFGRRRVLRAEALEDRRLLTAISPLPCSVVLLNQMAGNALPPDPCIQFSPQPIVAAAASNAVVHWQGRFSESVVESPTAAASSTVPAAWLVNTVYNLNGQPATTPTSTGTPGTTYNVTGTATETLTPLNAAGNIVATSQIWVSNEAISSVIVVSPSSQANPVANSFAFTTDTTINQKLAPLATTAGATNSPVWIANTVTDTTGIVTAPLLSAGTLSFQEKIHQTLVSASALDTTVGWTVDAEFDAAGSYRAGLVVPVAATNALAGPVGSLSLTGTLTGSVSPPAGMGMPTQLFSDKVTANVTFVPTLTPIPVPLTPPTALGTLPLSSVTTTGTLGPAPLLNGLRG
jgi:hypothetical protein